MGNFVNAVHASEEVKCSLRHFRKLITNGEIKTIKINNRIFVVRSELEKLMARKRIEKEGK